MMRLTLTVLLYLLIPLVFAQSNMWDEEHFLEALKRDELAEEEAAEMEIAKRGVTSWTSSGSGDWNTHSLYSTSSIAFSLTFVSSEELSGSYDEEDLIGAVTGMYTYYSTYEYTYIVSDVTYWESSGVVKTPDGSVSTWTSSYSSTWTSVYTDSYATNTFVSTWTSEWTSCTSGDVSWTSTYNSKFMVEPGAVASGENSWISTDVFSTIDTWVSSTSSGWYSVVTGEASSSSHSTESHSWNWKTRGRASS